MIHDRYRKKYRIPKGSSRLRHQIALEAARRLLQSHCSGEDEPPTSDDRRAWYEELAPPDYYVAKRKAAAVLGHRIREGDLPSDGEVREHLATLSRTAALSPEEHAPIEHPHEREHQDAVVPALADHLNRFALFRLRLEPLEAVKQHPKRHPEGDALYHSLQVFELARRERPYDEEFLLAALLHDVGKAISTEDHVAATVEALRGAVTPRTLWLIEHHLDDSRARKRLLAGVVGQADEAPEHLDDLKLLRALDEAGRVPGCVVGTVEEALAYIAGLEREEYLDA